MVSVVELRLVSTSSASELTVTTSWAPATDRVTGRSAMRPTVTDKFFTSALAKPGADTETVYWPGVRAIRRYSPLESPGAVRAVPLAWSTATTAALTTALPVGSFTLTCTSPVAAPWAAANTARHTSTRLTNASFTVSFIHSP